jgi:hypothetical protein
MTKSLVTLFLLMLSTTNIYGQLLSVKGSVRSTQTAVTLIANTLTLPTGSGGGVIVDTLGAQAKLIVNLSNKTVQDSVIMPTFSVIMSDTLTTTSDSVVISFKAGKFLFAQKGPYPVVVNGIIAADSARVNAAGTSLFIKITGPVSGTYDTLTVAGVYIKGQTTSGIAYSDSTSHDSLSFAIGRTAGTGFTAGLHDANGVFVLLPAPIYSISGIAIPADTTTIAGIAFNGGTVNCTDRWGNIPYDITTTVNISVVLNGTSTSPSGTLIGPRTKVATAGHPGACTQAWTAEKYTKAENIQLVYRAPMNFSGAVTSAAITVSPGTAANISAESISGYLYVDYITVDQTIQYTLTVTDQYFNPVVNGTSVTWGENIPHGGTGGTATTVNGQVAALFTPSKFFVGADTLVFTSGAATHSRAIMITSGALGGLLVDYAGTASGSATSEDIAAGTTVYARTFLRDTYGNPIDATSASQVTFSISGKLGKNTLLGTAALTSSMNQPLYTNTNKTAVGIAVPYTVSTNIRAGVDSVLATIGTYSATILIQNRSNVPATMKLVQSVAGDSSLIVSNYSNSTTYTDTVWDQYGNFVTAPSSTNKVAPLKAAYAMYFSTMGKAAFVRSADTTFADTLYPSAGIINRTIVSTKTAGLDTLKTWAAANAAVAYAVPVWITPGAFAKVVIASHVDTTAIAGKIETFILEKQDTYGNHIDFGLSGGQTRGNSPAAFTAPTAGQILSDSTAVVTDTVSTGKNRGGKVAKSTTTGTVGAASVGGSLNLSLKFTPYTVTADTQKFYASLGGFSDTVQVRSIPTGALSSFTVSGSVAYASSSANPIGAVAVTLTPATGTALTATSSATGTFSIANVPAGTYTLTASKTGGWGGANATDALLIAKHSAGITLLTGLPLAAGDVNNSGSVNNTDALQVVLRNVGTLTSFTAGDWTFQSQTVTVTNSNVTANISGLAVGDVNASYVPASGTVFAKSSAPINLTSGTDKFAISGSSAAALGAVSMRLNVNSAKVASISSKLQGFVSRVDDAGVSFGWFAKDEQAVQFNANEAIVTVTLADKASDKSNITIESELADIAGAAVNSNLALAVKAIPTVFELSQNYPNPFNPSTQIEFSIPQSSYVTLKVYDVLGKEIATLVNSTKEAGTYTTTWNAQDFPSGVYFYRLQASTFTETKKLVLLR